MHACTQNCVVTLTAIVSNKKNEIGIIKVHTNNVHLHIYLVYIYLYITAHCIDQFVTLISELLSI